MCFVFLTSQSNLQIYALAATLWLSFSKTLLDASARVITELLRIIWFQFQTHLRIWKILIVKRCRPLSIGVREPPRKLLVQAYCIRCRNCTIIWCINDQKLVQFSFRIPKFPLLIGFGDVDSWDTVKWMVSQTLKSPNERLQRNCSNVSFSSPWGVAARHICCQTRQHFFSTWAQHH